MDSTCASQEHPEQPAHLSLLHMLSFKLPDRFEKQESSHFNGFGFSSLPHSKQAAHFISLQRCFFIFLFFGL